MKKKLIDLTNEEYSQICSNNICEICPFNFENSIYACYNLHAIMHKINDVEKYLASNSKEYAFNEQLKKAVDYLKTTEVEIEEEQKDGSKEI